MHMADALLSPAVGLAMDAVSAAAIGISAARVKKDELGHEKIPIMGVAGALVFAGQMINFTIPATGSSGHIGGGILLAGLLGGIPAFLSISAVLIIQCLFFADGGLLALGCNIFNMGVIPCLLIYPLVFKPLLKGGTRTMARGGAWTKARAGAGDVIGSAAGAGIGSATGDVIGSAAGAGIGSAAGDVIGSAAGAGISYRRLSAASVASVVIGLELGAFCVVLQTQLSGITALPFGVFTALMLPIHLAIGLVEGIVTSAVLCFVYKMRPEIIETSASGEKLGGVPTAKVLVVLAALTIVAGGALSLFASVHPDGLEWAIEKSAEAEPDKTGSETDILESGHDARGGIFDGAASIQENTAFLPDYAFASEPDNPAGASVSGIVGAAITFALAGATGLIISIAKKSRRASVNG